MRWDRISVLIDKVKDDLDRQGFVCSKIFYEYFTKPSCRWFCLDDSQGEPTKLQIGAVRTNCMDNLDRTNVAQAAFAKWTLNQQLRELGIFAEHETVDDHEALVTDLRESESTLNPFEVFINAF